MAKPRINDQNHLKLDQFVLDWIRKQRKDPLTRQLPLPMAQVIARAVRFDHNLNLGVFEHEDTAEEADDFDDDHEFLVAVNDFLLQDDDSENDDSDYVMSQDGEDDEESNESDEESETYTIDSNTDTVDIMIDTNRKHSTWSKNFCIGIASNEKPLTERLLLVQQQKRSKNK